MRLLLGFALCFVFFLSGCSGEEVKTDTKNYQQTPQKPTKGSLQGKGGGRQVN